MNDEANGDVTHEWDRLADWWRSELRTDPAYEQAVVPLVSGMFEHLSGHVLDVGCGDGRIMGLLAECEGVVPIGCDINRSLLGEAQTHGSVFQAQLPGVPLADASLGGAIVVLAFEHFEDPVFGDLGRIIASGGSLVSVVNHPFITAPGSSSVIDPTDGEVFWRPGAYATSGRTVEDADGAPVTFIHRPLGTLLNLASAAGFSLDELNEVGLDAVGLPDAGLPRLIGVRWTRR